MWEGVLRLSSLREREGSRGGWIEQLHIFYYKDLSHLFNNLIQP
jgi:hypothetical protein